MKIKTGYLFLFALTVCVLVITGSSLLWGLGGGLISGALCAVLLFFVVVWLVKNAQPRSHREFLR